MNEYVRPATCSDGTKSSWPAFLLAEMVAMVGNPVMREAVMLVQG